MEPKGSLQRLQVPATCPCLEPAHSSPCLHPISWRSILINIKMPRPLKWPLSLRFPHQNPVYTSPIPHMHHMPHPSHSSRFFITWTILGEVYRSLSSSLCSFLHSLVTSSLLGPNILLNTLFSNTFSLCSSLNVSDQVLHPSKTTGKIIVLYILIFKLLDSKLKDKRFCTKWWQAILDFDLLFSSWIEFWFVKAVPKYLNSSILSKVLLSVFTVTSSCILILRNHHVLSFISIYS